jgi:ATP-binding cassette subfamily B protein
MNRFAGLRLLGPYLRPHRGRVALALLAVIVAAGTVLAFGVCLRALIDRGFGQGQSTVLRHALVWILVVAAILAVASGSRFYLVSWLGERVVGDLRRDLFAHVVRLGPAWFEIKRSGDVMSRISSDAQLIEQVIGSSASVALRNTLMCVGGIGMLVITNPKLAALVLALVPVVVAPIIIFGRKVRALSREAQARIADLVSDGAETLDGVRTVQAFAQEQRVAKRFGEATERAFAAAVRRITRRAIMTTLVIFIVFAAVGFLLWIGGQDVLAGRITTGDLSSFVFYAVLVASAGGAISETIADLQRASGAAERLSELKAEPPVILEAAHPSSPRQLIRGSIAFDEVVHRYPTRPDALALDRFDLKIAPGETVAIVGPSGAGKTTVFSLLLRFYDPEKGTVRVDGVDIRELRLHDLRRCLAIVPQEPMLFTATVADNIRYGRPGASEAKLRAAAEAASALGFIEALPEGFATHLGARGVRLSAGQRQRIAIARAMLCDPAILLLDEATSALDAESELAVQQALDGLMHKRTTLVIAHRLATVQKADRIVVIDGGRVVDVGTHAELARRGGLYARLAELQFSPSLAAA